MNSLFLFFTQSEGGAQSYLSRNGEASAANLADTISQFLIDTLQLDLMSSFEARAQSLNNDTIWRSFKDQSNLFGAAEAALQLEPNVLLLCGSHFRSQRTAEAIATQLALPICVDAKIDADPERSAKTSGLRDALSEWTTWLASQPQSPRLILVGTSVLCLNQWLKHVLPAEKSNEAVALLNEMTAENTVPAVFAAGYDSKNLHNPWIFD